MKQSHGTDALEEAGDFDAQTPPDQVESQELQRISMINALVSIWIAVFAAYFAMNAFQDGRDTHFDELCIARSGTLSTTNDGKKRTCVITQVGVKGFEEPQGDSPNH